MLGKKKEKFRTNDCKYIILTELPNKEIHSVLISSDEILDYINDRGDDMMVDDTVIYGITFDNNVK